MASIRTLSALLLRTFRASGRTKLDLQEAAGLNPRTLSHVLEGSRDYKVSTLLAVAERLGLEVVLVPKGAAGALSADSVEAPPSIQTRVRAALDKGE